MIAILHVPADAVLGMTRRVQALYLNVAKLEALAVGRCKGDAVTFLAAIDGQLRGAELGELLSKKSVSSSAMIGFNMPNVPSACCHQRDPSDCVLPVNIKSFLFHEHATYWCVLTMPIRLIWPSWIAFFKTGATLTFKVRTTTKANVRHGEEEEHTLQDEPGPR
jgi:hypothetical protein